jgi:phosphoglucosamine mutase
MAASGRELADLAGDLTTYPQVLLNVRVSEKRSLDAIPEVAAVTKRVEEHLDGNGRLLVRYSGTEPLLRVMLEGQDLQQIEEWARQIVDAVDKAIGERQ